MDARKGGGGGVRRENQNKFQVGVLFFLLRGPFLYVRAFLSLWGSFSTYGECNFMLCSRILVIKGHVCITAVGSTAVSITAVSITAVSSTAVGCTAIGITVILVLCGRFRILRTSIIPSCAHTIREYDIM